MGTVSIRCITQDVPRADHRPNTFIDSFSSAPDLGTLLEVMRWETEENGAVDFGADVEQTASDEGLLMSTAQLLGIHNVNRVERHPALVAVAGRALGSIFRLDSRETVIGRADEVHVTVQDDGVSRRHAKIVTTGELHLVHDLGSTNGTFVNDVAVKSATPIGEGDFLRIGSKTVLRFEFRDSLHDQVHGKLYELATRDPLTHALNRRAFNERLEHEWHWAVRHKNPIAVCVVDADHFKKVNDTHGHPAGDYVLSELSRLLQGLIRHEDALARVGGEEFVILARATPLDKALVLAERARSTVEEHNFVFGGVKIPVTISLGVSTSLDKRLSNASELLAQADAALYRAKHKGRNRAETLYKEP